MDKSTNDELVCSHCHNDIIDTNEFCPSCGSLFKDSIVCENHRQREAEAVCIICCIPLCSECGGRVNGLFLCEKHENYEIYQGMARVFGMSDEAQARYAHSCLEQAGFHPFLYSRKVSPISLGGPDYTLFRASGEYDGHIINEIKVMVPCQEVVRAEQVLRDLDILS